MSKAINNIPEQFLKQLSQLGYRPVKAEDQRVFEPYYDAMNGHYASVFSFPCLLELESEKFSCGKMFIKTQISPE